VQLTQDRGVGAKSNACSNGHRLVVKFLRGQIRFLGKLGFSGSVLESNAFMLVFLVDSVGLIYRDGALLSFVQCIDDLVECVPCVQGLAQGPAKSSHS
jgi:hypothetical protein